MTSRAAAADIYERLGWRGVATTPWLVVNGVPLDKHYYVSPDP